MRFRLRAGQRSSKYKPGQFVSADYAKRYPKKARKDRKRRGAPPKPPVVPPPPPPPAVEELWEVTGLYEP